MGARFDFASSQANSLSAVVKGNMRLQEMMAIMAEERGGRVFATDERSVLRLILPFLREVLTRREIGSASTTAL